jgi:hypothetical protein
VAGSHFSAGASGMLEKSLASEQNGLPISLEIFPYNFGVLAGDAT